MRHWQRYSLYNALQYFNPRTREGCDFSGRPSAGRGADISIHAPVKGATLSFVRVNLYTIISIHAPVKGATKCVICASALPVRFQSTHPWRVRQKANLYYFSSPLISIHAPVKGATTHFSTAGKSRDISIHAPVKGATTIDATHQILDIVFQSTHPWRVRQLINVLFYCISIISIHAPVKGAT